METSYPQPISRRRFCSLAGASALALAFLGAGCAASGGGSSSSAGVAAGSATSASSAASASSSASGAGWQERTLFAFDVEKPEFYAYIKAADKISAYTKCLEEQRSGNREFDRAARQLYDAIAAMHMPEADCFMQQFVPAFGLTLDELQADETL